MPQGRTKRARIRQLAAWLVDQFKTPYPVKIRFTRKLPPGCFAVCDRVDRRLWILLDSRYAEHVIVDSLLHEYAHAMSWRQDAVENRREEHDDEWAIMYGRLYRCYHDRGGKPDTYKY